MDKSRGLKGGCVVDGGGGEKDQEAHVDFEISS